MPYLCKNKRRHRTLRYIIFPSGFWGPSRDLTEHKKTLLRVGLSHFFRLFSRKDQAAVAVALHLRPQPQPREDFLGGAGNLANQPGPGAGWRIGTNGNRDDHGTGSRGRCSSSTFWHRRVWWPTTCAPSRRRCRRRMALPTSCWPGYCPVPCTGRPWTDSSSAF